MEAPSKRKTPLGMAGTIAFRDVDLAAASIKKPLQGCNQATGIAGGYD